jgi:proline iminopeptidase
MPPREGYATMPDGVRLFFSTLGSGPKTVVIPNGFHLYDDFAPLVAGRTLIFYDVRHRGRSEEVARPTRVRRGIHDDVSDLEAVRRYFGIDAMNVIGHSYMGLMAILYALEYAAHLARVVQVGPTEPYLGKSYPAHLTGADDTLRDVFVRLGQLRAERDSVDPQEFCRRFWAVLRLIYVVNPEDAHRVDWGRCDLPNERGFMKYWTESLLPSLKTLDLSAERLARVQASVLIIHGTRDRSAPYGGGREWAMRLKNARLVTIENAGHAPWIEAPQTVLGSIATFLDGAWPAAAQKVVSLDLADQP